MLSYVNLRNIKQYYIMLHNLCRFTYTYVNGFTLSYVNSRKRFYVELRKLTYIYVILGKST